MTINEMLEALAAAPKPFRVTINYECGNTRFLDCLSAAAAENFASGERPKIGRNLIERETGRMVRVVSVVISEN